MVWFVPWFPNRSWKIFFTFASLVTFFPFLTTHQHSQSPFSALLSTVVFLFHLFAAFLCFFRLCCFSSSHTASPEAITEKRCELSWTGDKTKLRGEKFLGLEIFTVIISCHSGPRRTENKKRWRQTSDSIEPQSIALRFLWFLKGKSAKKWRRKACKEIGEVAEKLADNFEAGLLECDVEKFAGIV